MDIWVEGFQSFKNLKSVKKGPISKFEGGQFEAWEKAELEKHEEPTSLEVSFLLPLFVVVVVVVVFFLKKKKSIGDVDELKLVGIFFEFAPLSRGDANELELVGTFFEVSPLSREDTDELKLVGFLKSVFLYGAGGGAFVFECVPQSKSSLTSFFYVCSFV